MKIKMSPSWKILPLAPQYITPNFSQPTESINFRPTAGAELNCIGKTIEIDGGIVVLIVAINAH